VTQDAGGKTPLNEPKTLAATEVERLLVPISAEAPAGAPLRYEGTYEQVRELRREDDPSLPLGEWARPLKVANPSGVAAICEEALTERSKDLQLAVWLADAWAQLDGLRGVTRALMLVVGLCERFWETMFPGLDGDGDDLRVALIDWLGENLAVRIRTVRLGDERAAFSVTEWERAGLEARPGGSSEAPAASRESLLAKVSSSGVQPWIVIRRESAAALAALEALERCLAQRLDAPTSLRRTRDVLVAIQAIARDVLKGSGELEAQSPTPDEAKLGLSAPGQPAAEAGYVAMDGRIVSRADAYRRLTEAADYLLHTEPHSPVPYLVKRAIQWGNMSLAELLQEFIGNADDLVTVHRLLGMRPRDE
jgi:type VI secretion system protein ImpA